MKIVGIIPARYASKRFAGKPLANIDGKSMIQRVYEQASKSQQIYEVIVATDDTRIFKAVNGFGGKVQMTSTAHRNGTERCNEVAAKINCDFIVNIQGDEPFIQPQQIDELCDSLTANTELATLIKRIESNEELLNPNVVKVVKSNGNHALYFSRQAIPFLSNQSIENWHHLQPYWKHIGIYAYKKSILEEVVNLPESALEKAESLEQLRWIENGYQIKLKETVYNSSGIDTPDDLEKAIKFIGE